MNIIISVVITTYKRDNSILKRAIDSALAQTYSNIEIIIINDYYENKNNIEQLLNTYNAPIRLFHNRENKGACYSRNVGLKNAKGSYVAFLDDDDEWEPEKLQEQLSVMTSSDIAMVYCTGLNVYPDGSRKIMSFIKDYPATCQLEYLLGSNYMGGCSFPLIRTDILHKLGGFDELMQSSQDYDLWIRICQSYKIAYLPKPLVLYYIMADSITSSSKKRVQGYRYLLKKHRELYKRYPRSAVKIYNSIVSVYIQHKEYRKIIVPIIESFRFFPYNLSILTFWLSVVFKK